jgi:ribosomal protein L25 (general stress protein Ctc)
MRETLELKVEPRSKFGKGASYQIRKSGLIPGIVYGGKGDPQPAGGRAHPHQASRHRRSLQTLVMLDWAEDVIPRACSSIPLPTAPSIDFCG